MQQHALSESMMKQGKQLLPGTEPNQVSPGTDGIKKRRSCSSREALELRLSCRNRVIHEIGYPRPPLPLFLLLDDLLPERPILPPVPRRLLAPPAPPFIPINLLLLAGGVGGWGRWLPKNVRRIIYAYVDYLDL